MKKCEKEMIFVLGKQENGSKNERNDGKRYPPNMDNYSSISKDGQVITENGADQEQTWIGEQVLVIVIGVLEVQVQN